MRHDAASVGFFHTVFDLIELFFFRFIFNFWNFFKIFVLYSRDGTGQDFLDPTRPVNFKIIAGWRVFLQQVFVHFSMYAIKNF